MRICTCATKEYAYAFDLNANLAYCNCPRNSPQIPLKGDQSAQLHREEYCADTAAPTAADNQKAIK